MSSPNVLETVTAGPRELVFTGKTPGGTAFKLALTGTIDAESVEKIGEVLMDHATTLRRISPGNQPSVYSPTADVR